MPAAFLPLASGGFPREDERLRFQSERDKIMPQFLAAILPGFHIALHRARIAPPRLSASLTQTETAALVPIIRTVLTEAIDAGGSSLRDYRQTDGELGYFQHTFRVYDRAGQPCPQCQTPILRIVQSNRSSFYCPTCQV